MAIHSHAPPPPIRCSVPTEKGVAFAPPHVPAARLGTNPCTGANACIMMPKCLPQPGFNTQKSLASTADITNHWGCQQKFIAKIHRKILRASAWEREDALQASPRSG